VLYITIFDHKERANTRVYTQRSGADHFYATESSLPTIDPKQGLLEIKLSDEIDNQDDPITSDLDIRSKLRAHYRSIMDQMYFAIRQSEWDPTYTIENKWTMTMGHTTSTPQRKGEAIRGPTANAITLSARDFRYLQHRRVEKIIQSLCSARGEWIATYNHWGVRELRERFMLNASTGMASDVDEAPTGSAKAEGKRRMLADEKETRESPSQVRPVGSNQEDIESQVIDQIRRMELLLVHEMQTWEEHFWYQAKRFIGRYDVLEKARLTKEWERGFRARLDTAIREMEDRLDAAELEVKASRSGDLARKWQSAYEDIRKAWQALAGGPTPAPQLPNLEHDQTEYQAIAQDVEAIIRWSKLTPGQCEQLRQQSEVASRSIFELQEAVYWMDGRHGLTEYKLSRSKWLYLDMRRVVTEPLEVYKRVLRTMNDVTFVGFGRLYPDDCYALVAELIHDLPSSVTSIFSSLPDSRKFPAIQRDTPLFINDFHGSNKIETFLHDNQSQLARTRRTHIFMDFGSSYPFINRVHLGLSPSSKIAISFFGPPSGNLLLKFTHSSPYAAETLILKESYTSSTFQCPVPFALTVTTITLSPSPSDHPSFVPNTRNNLIIQATRGNRGDYGVKDIQLHDEAGNDYNPASPEAYDGADVMAICSCACIFLVMITGWNDAALYHRIIWRPVYASERTLVHAT
jgi:hypothetical protein